MTDEYDRLWALRDQAIRTGDFNLAEEVGTYMTRRGFTVPDLRLDDTPAMKERAVSHNVPAKRNK